MADAQPVRVQLQRVLDTLATAEAARLNAAIAEARKGMR